MTVKVGINGFGRIGRGFLRAALDKKGFEIVAANDLTNEQTLAHLLKYDTVMGRFTGTVDVGTEGDNVITVNGKPIQILSEIQRRFSA